MNVIVVKCTCMKNLASGEGRGGRIINIHGRPSSRGAHDGENESVTDLIIFDVLWDWGSPTFQFLSNLDSDLFSCKFVIESF